MDSYVILPSKKSVRSIGRRTSNTNMVSVHISHSQAASNNNSHNNSTVIKKVNRQKARVAKSLVKQHNGVATNNIMGCPDDNSFNVEQNLQVFDKFNNQLRPGTQQSNSKEAKGQKV